MFETLKRLWDDREINGMTLQKLKNAVSKPVPWITDVQFKEITGEDYVV